MIERDQGVPLRFERDAKARSFEMKRGANYLPLVDIQKEFPIALHVKVRMML